MMEPISVWELEAGRPKYQVPRFQMIAEISRANTMANPAPDPTLSTSSTGNNARTPERHRAGGGEHTQEVPTAGPHYGDGWLQCVSVDDGRDGVCRVVESVDKLETQRQTEREQKEEGAAGRNRLSKNLQSILQGNDR